MSEYIIQIISIAGALFGVMVGALLNHFLEKNRSKANFVLNKKVEVYSKILIKLNTVFQEKERNIINDGFFKDRIGTYMAEALSEGRLLAGKKLEIKFRDYFDIAQKWWDCSKNDTNYESVSSKMNQLVIEIEQLMREEIGNKKLY